MRKPPNSDDAVDHGLFAGTYSFGGDVGYAVVMLILDGRKTPLFGSPFFSAGSMGSIKAILQRDVAA